MTEKESASALVLGLSFSRRPAHQAFPTDWLGRGPNGKVGEKLHEIYLIDPDVVGLKRAALAAKQPDVALKRALMQ